MWSVATNLKIVALSKKPKKRDLIPTLITGRTSQTIFKRILSRNYGKLSVYLHDLYLNCLIIFILKKLTTLHTVENSDSWKVRFCIKIQSSQISNFLGIFQIQKMDIISCHDCQFVKCKSQINKLAWFDFKYKKVHIHRIWDNEN